MQHVIGVMLNHDVVVKCFHRAYSEYFTELALAISNFQILSSTGGGAARRRRGADSNACNSNTFSINSLADTWIIICKNFNFLKVHCLMFPYISSVVFFDLHYKTFLDVFWHPVIIDIYPSIDLPQGLTLRFNWLCLLSSSFEVFLFSSFLGGPLQILFKKSIFVHPLYMSIQFKLCNLDVLHQRKFYPHDFSYFLLYNFLLFSFEIFIPILCLCLTYIFYLSDVNLAEIKTSSYTSLGSVAYLISEVLHDMQVIGKIMFKIMSFLLFSLCSLSSFQLFQLLAISFPCVVHWVINLSTYYCLDILIQKFCSSYLRTKEINVGRSLLFNFCSDLLDPPIRFLSFI